MARRFLSNVRINDAYTLPASDGTNNQVIKTDGSGNLTFGQLATDSASVIYKDTFTGDGSTTAFTMANALNDENQSNIYIDGVYQSKSTYSVANKVITFSTAPASGHAIEVISTTGINSGPTAIYTDNFTANGSTTAFTLGQTVHDENQTLVFLNGVYQFKNTYSLSGTTLTLDTAPANGVAIEVMSIGSAYSGGDILYDHDFTSAGLMKTDGSGTYSIVTDNSSNWNTAYTYSQVGHLPLAGGTLTGNVIFNDNVKAKFGSSSDLEIYHDGSKSVITDVGTGALRIAGTNFELRNADQSKFYMNASDGGAINLYYDNSKKLETTSTGVSVTGNLSVSGDLTINGTTTTLNTQTVEVEDNILQLNTTQGSPDTATATTSGISIYRGNGVTQASFIFDDGDDTWDLTNNLVVAGNITLNEDLNFSTNGYADISNTGTGAMRFKPSSQTLALTLTGANATFSGNVGIGAAPSNKLHIQQAKSGSNAENYDLLRFNLTGTGAIGDSSSIVWYSTSGTKTAGIEGISGQDNILYGELAFNVRKYTTDSFDEAMRINNRGNVGIGTTSPNGNLQFSNAAETRKIVLYEGANNDYQFYGFGVESQTLVYSTYTRDDDHVFFAGVTSSTRDRLMTIAGDGNVGIGVIPNPKVAGNIRLDVGYIGCGITSRQNAELVLTSNADYVTATTTGRNAIMVNLQNNGDFNILNAPSTTAGSALTFTSRFYINTSGNVGIGTTSPDAIFHVSKANSGGLGGQIVIDNPAGSALGNSVEISFLTDTGASGSGTRNARILAVNENAGNGAANMQFHTWNGSASAERMRITSAGNVGIGFSYPDGYANLTVSGTSSLPILGLRSSSGKVRLGFYEGGTGRFYLDSLNGSDGLAFIDGDGSTERMRIDSSGNVNIGNGIAEEKRLIIDCSNPVFALKETDQSADSRVWGMQSIASKLYFRAFNDAMSSATDVLVLNRSGNVGIGTTTPVNTYSGLTVSGSNPSIALKTTSGSGWVWQQYVNSSGTNNFSAGVNQSVPYYGIKAGAGLDSPHFAIDSSGNVGINTITPSAKLSVAAAGANGLQLEPDTGSTSNSARLFWKASTGAWAIMNNSQNFSIRSGAVVGSTSGTEKIRLSGYSATSWTSGSDETMKENIISIGNVLDKIQNYRCVEYNLIDDETADKKIGFIAQDWQEDFPQIIEQMENEKIGMKYTETIPILLKAIQELKAEIETLKNQING